MFIVAYLGTRFDITKSISRNCFDWCPLNQEYNRWMHIVSKIKTCIMLVLHMFQRQVIHKCGYDQIRICTGEDTLATYATFYQAIIKYMFCRSIIPNENLIISKFKTKNKINMRTKVEILLIMHTCLMENYFFVTTLDL